jgi:RimJ/RimL family protein N-acetyltransferase
MHYREHISAEQQERWFAALDPLRDYYFIVEFEGQKIGLSTLKNVDFVHGSAEGGLFLVPKLLRNSLISYRASLPGLDWIYRELGLRTVSARMRRENKRALRFNRSIGHVVDESLSNAESVVTVQTRERWEAARPEYVRIFGEWYALGETTPEP